MKKQPLFQVDAFSSAVFGGNPSAVCPLDHWLDDRSIPQGQTLRYDTHPIPLILNSCIPCLSWCT